MKYVIYGKPNCPYCEMAKNALTVAELPFTYLTLNEDFTVEGLIEMVIAKTGVRPSTFPQIFALTEEDLDYVGGYTQLNKHLQEQ